MKICPDHNKLGTHISKLSVGVIVLDMGHCPWEKMGKWITGTASGHWFRE